MAAVPHTEYRRVLLKISGEVLMESDAQRISTPRLMRVADEVRAIHEQGVQVALVIGAGNIYRGVAGADAILDRASADYMGMLATTINALALRSAFEAAGMPTRIISGLDQPRIAEPYDQRRAIGHLESGRVIVFAAGTGNPYFTTDTAAALRALEIGADVVLKATKVDGIYSADPMTHPDAKRYDRLTYDECLRQRLRVMDLTAFSLCRDNGLPLVVFEFGPPSNVLRAIRGEPVGTRVDAGQPAD